MTPLRCDAALLVTPRGAKETGPFEALFFCGCNSVSQGSFVAYLVDYYTLGAIDMRVQRPTIGFYMAVTPALLLAWRIVWEQTSLSWQRGPQMIGFSLIHGPGLLLVLAFYAALVWGALTLVFAVLSQTRRNRTNLGGVLVIATCAALVFAPSGIWVRIFAANFAQSQHASEFLVHMAALGDIGAVEALLDHGVPIDAANRQGLRAIDAAENAHQVPMRDFLAHRRTKEF